MDRLTLRDVMTREFASASESDGLDAAADHLRRVDADAAVVLRGDDPVGLLTVTDALDGLRGDDATVGDAMSDPPASLRPEATASDGLEALRRRGDDYLLVRDGEGVRGLVHVRDLAHASVAGAPEEAPSVEGDLVEGDAGPIRANGGDPDAFSRQSVCEVCGTLAETLTNRNGQLVCTDCQDV